MALSAFQISYAGVDKDKGNSSIKEDVIALNDQIKQNNEELSNLREQMATLTVSIQSKVLELSSDKTAITQAKAADLKTVLSIIKTSKKNLKESKNDGLKQSISESKTAREDKEFKQAGNSMKKVLELQEKRKQKLTVIINDLNTADQLL
jgi:hypothetical protein